ncbi:MAG: hypothetical protein HYY18_22745 [Planctomycetes bacterium]|nr:hypothetical protein [Planctomycetota bacterium]
MSNATDNPRRLRPALISVLAAVAAIAAFLLLIWGIGHGRETVRSARSWEGSGRR